MHSNALLDPATMAQARKVQSAIHALHDEMYSHHTHTASFAPLQPHAHNGMSSKHAHGKRSNGSMFVDTAAAAAAATDVLVSPAGMSSDDIAMAASSATSTSPMHAQRTHGNGNAAAAASTTSAAVVVVAPATTSSQATTAASRERIAYNDFLHRRSFEFVLCVGLIVCNGSYFLVYNLAVLSNALHDVLEPKLHAPWPLFRLLGSRGVDIADPQWYYFITCLPPGLLALALFLVVSRQVRRRNHVGGTAAVVPDADSMTCAEVVAHGDKDSNGGGSGEFDARQRGGAKRRGSIAARLQRRWRTLLLRPAQAMSSTSSPQQQQQQQHTSRLHTHAASPSFAPLCERGVARLQWLHIVCGAVLALGISGPGVLFAFALMVINYAVFAQLHRRAPPRTCLACMWLWHIATLFVNNHANGYRFAWFGLGFLDNVPAPVLRWTVHYNMTLLRLIAYNCDAWEAHTRGGEQRLYTLRTHERTCVECAALRDAHAHAHAHHHDAARTAAAAAAGGGVASAPTAASATANAAPATIITTAVAPPATAALTTASLPVEALCCYKCRSACPQPLDLYTMRGYFGYVLYPPLYLAGPMITYNAYVSYLRWPTRGIVGRAVWRYALRFVLSALLLVTLMHYMHIVAILRTQTYITSSGMLTSTAMPLFDTLDMVHRSAVFFMTLAFLWLKFNVIWKLFRLLALLDGVEPPEDMRRCFANTVNIQGFWRDWHASFNLWIVRYMYIPMGGSKRKHLSIFPIFIFIAVWHDLDLRLLYWAVCICLCLLPELAVTRLFASRRSRLVRALRQRKLLWRYVRTLGCTLGMLELVCINLVGFAVGAHGIVKGLHDLYAGVTWRYVFMVGSHFFMGATIAIQSRDQEAYELQQRKLRYHLPLS